MATNYPIFTQPSLGRNAWQANAQQPGLPVPEQGLAAALNPQMFQQQPVVAPNNPPPPIFRHSNPVK